MKNFFLNFDGVNVLLANRSEVGWKAIPERNSFINNDIRFSSETIPEHLHHNWKFTDAYKKSKEARGVEAANSGQFSKGFTNPKYW